MRGGPEERCQELKELAEVPGWNTRPGLESGETEAELRLRHGVLCSHLRKTGFSQGRWEDVERFLWILLFSYYWWLIFLEFTCEIWYSIYVFNYIEGLPRGSNIQSIFLSPTLMPGTSTFSGSAELLTVSTFTVLYKTSHYQAPKYLSLKK